MFQGLVFLGAVFICISLPVVLVIESIKFSQDDRMETAVEWQKAKTIAYPNITVCYSKFFDKRRLASKCFLKTILPRKKPIVYLKYSINSTWTEIHLVLYLS